MNPWLDSVAPGPNMSTVYAWLFQKMLLNSTGFEKSGVASVTAALPTMFWVAGRLMTKLWPGVTESTVALAWTPVPDTFRPTSLAVTAGSSTSVPSLVVALASVLLMVSLVVPVLVAAAPEMVKVCAATFTLLIVRVPLKRVGFELVTVRPLSAAVMLKSKTVVDPAVVRTGRAVVLLSIRRIVSDTPLAVCVAGLLMMKL